MRKVIIIGGILLVAIVAGVIIYVKFYKKKPEASKIPGTEPGEGNVTNVAAPNTVEGQAAAIQNAQNAGKKVIAKVNSVKPYVFVTATDNSFPIYEKTTAPLDVYNANAVLGDYVEAFTAVDLNAAMNEAASQAVSKLKGYATTCSFMGNVVTLNYFNDFATAMNFLQNRRSIANFKVLARGGIDTNQFNGGNPTWGAKVCFYNGGLPPQTSGISNGIIYFDKTIAEQTFYKVNFNGQDLFFNAADVKLQ